MTYKITRFDTPICISVPLSYVWGAKATRARSKAWAIPIEKKSKKKSLQTHCV